LLAKSNCVDIILYCQHHNRASYIKASLLYVYFFKNIFVFQHLFTFQSYQSIIRKNIFHVTYM